MDPKEKTALGRRIRESSLLLRTRSKRVQLWRTGVDIAIPVLWALLLATVRLTDHAVPRLIAFIAVTAIVIGSTGLQLLGFWSIPTYSRALSARGLQLIGRLERSRGSQEEDDRIIEIADEVARRAGSRGLRSWRGWRPWINGLSPYRRLGVGVQRRLRVRRR